MLRKLNINMSKNNYNPYLKKMIIKNLCILSIYFIILFIILFLFINLSDRIEERLFYLCIIMTIIFAFNYKIINIKKILAGIKAEKYVNSILKSNGVIFSSNVIINDREIDHIIYYPKLVVLETKYGKGRITKKINNSITINNKSINKNNIKQAIRNCNIINIITKKSGYNLSFEPVLCFSNSFGEIVYGEVVIVSGESLISYLYKNKNMDIKSAMMIKNFLDNI